MKIKHLKHFILRGLFFIFLEKNGTRVLIVAFFYFKIISMMNNPIKNLTSHGGVAAYHQHVIYNVAKQVFTEGPLRDFLATFMF